MNACKKTARNLAAFLGDELGESERSRIEAHLEICPRCREELRRLKEVFRAANSLSGEMERAIASVDWNELPNRIANRLDEEKMGGTQISRPKKMRTYLLRPGFRFIYAGLLLGLVIGSAATFLVFRTRIIDTPQNGGIIVPRGFYDKMELEMARRETLDYLLGSEYLLLDFVQSSPERSSEFWRSDFASRKAKDLLSKKKYIDPQLDKFQLAKAKAICDQIELLFFELTQMSDRLSGEELKKVQDLIEERQILLKIKLVRKELEKSEV
jgi:hypothetical protein